MRNWGSRWFSCWNSCLYSFKNQNSHSKPFFWRNRQDLNLDVAFLWTATTRLHIREFLQSYILDSVQNNTGKVWQFEETIWYWERTTPHFYMLESRCLNHLDLKPDVKHNPADNNKEHDMWWSLQWLTSRKQLERILRNGRTFQKNGKTSLDDSDMNKKAEILNWKRKNTRLEWIFEYYRHVLVLKVIPISIAW